VIDLRSDTVTQATDEMRQAMAEAVTGDDVYEEDPTVRRLERLAAARVGKEAALFVPTGTMGNQVAVLTHTQRGQEVIVDEAAHVYDAEVAGLAVLSGVQVRPLTGRRGILEAGEVAAAIRPDDVHYPRTGLLCLENPHNAAGGVAAPPEVTAHLCQVAHDSGIPVHLDGARLFNAAVALGLPAAALAEPVDSVMFCLSKGLGAPVGSVLAGSHEWIARARRYRKMLGGGMRQAGHLAAAGIVALERMVTRLAQDHDHARRLAEGLAGVPGFAVDMESVQTNMVYAEVGDGPAVVRALEQHGVLAGAVGPRRVGFVTHYGIEGLDVEAAINAAGQAIGLAATGPEDPRPRGGDLSG